MRKDGKLTGVWFAALFAALFGGANAQENAQDAQAQIASEQNKQGDTLSLSLEQAVDIALSDNPTIKVNDMEIAKADYAKRESYSGLFPSVTATAGYTRTVKKQVMTMDMGGNAMEIEMGNDNQWTGGFGAGMALFNMQLYRGISLSKTAVEAKVQAAHSSKIKMVSSVIEAYYQILNIQDTYEVLKKSYKLAEVNYDLAKKRYDQGLASEYDALQAEVQLKNIKPNLLSLENNIELLKLQLKVLMGLNADQPIKVQGSLADLDNGIFEASNVSVDEALAENTTMKELAISQTLLEKQLKLQKAAWYPTLSLQFTWQWIKLHDDTYFSDKDFNPYSTLAFNLSFPIFQGGSRYYKQKQAQIAYDEMQYTIEDTKRKLGMQVQSALDQVKVSLENIQTTKDAKDSAEKGLKIAQKRYEVGAGSFIELTSSDNANTQAQHAYFQALYDYVVAKNALDEVMGNAYETYINNQNNQK